jgi:peptidoglycan/LPS O-acetylase OafA/YrhL
VAEGRIYRLDIDGIRALAVLLVVAFHINEAIVPGGFIGVDVFFVISGYLITGNIVRALQTSDFSFQEFFVRRFRRIFPAMFLVTFCTLLVGSLIMLPADVESLAWSAVATVFSAANIYFTYFLDTSYFASDSAMVPLLHMWSLGVEEQFYLVWPIVLVLAWKFGFRPGAVLVGVIVTSVAIGQWQLSAGYFEWAYYMLPSRAFQLSTGGLLVFLPQLMRNLALAASSLGLLLILGSAYFLNGSMAFPGIYAVPVTLGAALLLASGAHSTPISKTLSLRPLRAVGLISYSLYLWHWPVLAFQRYFVGELEPLAQALSFVIMLVLATLSYRFVELPFRRAEFSFSGALRKLVLGPSAVLTLFAGGLISSNGQLPFDRERGSASAAVIEPAPRAPYVCQSRQVNARLASDPRCLVNTSADTDILMWGDSNSSHYVGALRELAQHQNFGFRNIAHSACPPLLEDGASFAAQRNRDTCAASLEVVETMLPRYSQIVVSAAWDTYLNARGEDFEEALRVTLQDLVRQGKKVVVLGRVARLSDFDPACLQKKVRMPILDCEASASRNRTDRVNRIIQTIAEEAGARYVDFNDILCPAGQCRDRLGEEVVYLDPGHISRTGSELLGREAIKADFVFPIEP